MKREDFERSPMMVRSMAKQSYAMMMVGTCLLAVVAIFLCLREEAWSHAVVLIPLITCTFPSLYYLSRVVCSLSVRVEKLEKELRERA